MAVTRLGLLGLPQSSVEEVTTGYVALGGTATVTATLTVNRASVAVAAAATVVVTLGALRTASVSAAGTGTATVGFTALPISTLTTLAVINAWDEATVSEVTLYASTTGYVSSPSGDPPNTVFVERLIEAPSYRQDEFDAATTSGRSRMGVGSAVLNNADHGIDSWLDYGFDGRTVKFYQGDRGGKFPLDFTLVFQGTMLPPDADQTTIRLNLVDGQALLDRDWQTTRYAGTNVLPDGLEGVEGDLKGKPKPVVLGKVLNASPPCVNTARLIYQVNDGPITSLDAVYDGGVALATGIGPEWEDISIPYPSGSMYGVVYDSVREQFVAVGRGGSRFNIITSPDGVTWTGRTTSRAVEYADIAFDGQAFIGVGVGSSLRVITYSPDSVVWTDTDPADHPFTSGDVRRVTVGPGVGANGESRWLTGDVLGVIATSDDAGVTWAIRTLPGSGARITMLHYANGLFMAGLSDGQLSSSTDAVTWTSLGSPLGSVEITEAAYSPSLDRWVIGGTQGKMARSDDDGATWTLCSPGFPGGTSAGIRDVIWVAGISSFMAFANDLSVSPVQGDFRMSPDGITWTAYNVGRPANQISPGQPLSYHAALGVTVILARDSSQIDNSGVAGPFAFTYASEADLLDDTLEPAPGAVGVYLAGGYFRLGSVPAGEITADVTQGATAADRTAGQLMVQVFGRAGLVAGQWSATDITSLDAKNSAELGYWSGLQETTCARVADAIMHSVGGWWGSDELSVLRVGLLEDPTSLPSSRTLTERSVDMAGRGTSLRRIRLNDPGQGVPTYKTVVGYARHWTVQTSGIFGAVGQDRRERLARQFLEATSEHAAVQLAHPLSHEQRRDTLLVNQADAEALAERLQRMFGFRGEPYEFNTEFEHDDPIRINDVVTLSNPYYGLVNGKRFVVIGREVRPTALPPTMTLKLWRPASSGVVMPAGTATVTATLGVV